MLLCSGSKCEASRISLVACLIYSLPLRWRQCEMSVIFHQTNSEYSAVHTNAMGISHSKMLITEIARALASWIQFSPSHTVSWRFISSQLVSLQLCMYVSLYASDIRCSMSNRRNNRSSLSVRAFLQSPITSSLLWLSDTLNCVVWRPYKTPGQIIIWYVSMFVFLDRRDV